MLMNIGPSSWRFGTHRDLCLTASMDKGVPGYFDGGREAGNFAILVLFFPFALANLLTPSTALPPYNVFRG